jgi:hypothetical protein
MQRGLAAKKHVLQAGLVDVKVRAEGGVDPGGQADLALLKFPEQVEGLACSAHCAAARMHEPPTLKGIRPGASGFTKAQDTGLALVHHAVEQPEQVYTVDRLVRWRRTGGHGRAGLALWKELHAFPYYRGAFSSLDRRTRDRSVNATVIELSLRPGPVGFGP